MFVIELLSLKVFAARANFPVVIQTISVQKRIHRGDAEYAEKRILNFMKQNSELRDLCALRSVLLVLLWLRLCRARRFVVRSLFDSGTVSCTSALPRQLFAHLGEEAAGLEILHDTAGNDLLQVGFLNLRVDPGEQALEKSPGLKVRSNV